MKPDPNDSEFDRRLRKELHGLAVPASLAERLKANILELGDADIEQASESPLDSMIDSALTVQPVVAHADDSADAGTVENSRGLEARTKRERRWFLSLGATTVAVALGVAVFHFATTPTGLTKRALAAWMEDELEDLEAVERKTLAHSLPPTVLAFLIQNLQLQKMGVSDKYEIPISQETIDVSELQGTAWKLVGDAGVLYVAVLENVNLSETLSPTLEVIQNSGAWNLAATSHEGKVILLAARGDIRRYFSPRPFA